MKMKVETRYKIKMQINYIIQKYKIAYVGALVKKRSYKGHC